MHTCGSVSIIMTLICMRMKLHAELIFISKVSHLDSFWNRGTKELGNGLLARSLLFLKIMIVLKQKFNSSGRLEKRAGRLTLPKNWKWTSQESKYTVQYEGERKRKPVKPNTWSDRVICIVYSEIIPLPFPPHWTLKGILLSWNPDIIKKKWRRLCMIVT